MVKKLLNIKINNYLFIIVIFTLILRLIGIDKMNGFWLDEMTSYECSKNLSWPNISYPYFYILHLWMKLFGEQDVLLRLLSVLAGILTIPIVYLTGKELNSRKLGFISAIFIAINSPLIYYSQEVRYYSFLALFSILSFLFLLKVKNKPVKKHYIGLIIANLAILYSFLIGFAFVAAQTLLFLIYLYVKDKQNIKPFIYSQIITLLCYLPFLFTLPQLLFTNSFASNFVHERFDLTSPIYIFQNWFSPIITSLYSADTNYFVYFSSLSPELKFYIIIPMLISLSAIVVSLQRKNFAGILFAMIMSFFIVEILASSINKFMLIVRYTIPCIPIMLIIIAYGLCNIRNKIISGSLIFIFISLNLYYILFMPVSAPKISRPEGFAYISNIIKQLNFNKNDIIIMPYGGNYIKKYYGDDKANIYPLSIFEAGDYKNDKFLSIKLRQSINKNNAHDILRSYLGSSSISKTFENNLNLNLIKKINKGDHLVIVLAPMLTVYNENTLINIANDDALYKKLPITQLLYIKLSNDLIKICSTNLKIVKAGQAGLWRVYIFQKK